MAISAALQRIEAVIAASPEPVRDAADAHPVLLGIAEVLSSPPYAVVGPQARLRWLVGDTMVEAGVDRWLDTWEIGYRAFPYEPDISRNEYLAFEYASTEVTPPYLWSLDLAERSPLSWQPTPFPLPGWSQIATELGYLVGILPKDLATIPPQWFNAPVVLTSTLAGTDVEARADRHGLVVQAPSVRVELDPERAYLASAVLGRAWATVYAARPPGALRLSVAPTVPAFRLLAEPRDDGPGSRVPPPALFADLASFEGPAVSSRAPGPDGGPFVATYATPEQGAALVVEAVDGGVPAFLAHHRLADSTHRVGLPELRAEEGWRVRIRSGTMQLTLLESHHHPAAVLDYTRRLLDRLEDAYGTPWGSSLDSRSRLGRTWRVGEMAVRAGSSGNAAMVEITSYRDLVTYHFG